MKARKKTSSQSKGRKTVLIALTSLMVVGPVQAQWGYAPPEQSFFEKFLLPAAGAAVGGLLGSVIQSVGGKIFSSLMADKPPPAQQTMQTEQTQQQMQPQQPYEQSAQSAPPVQQYQQQGQPVQPLQQLNLPANNAGMTNAVFLPAPPPITQNVAAVTGIIYAIDRLNPDYSIRETITPQAGVAPTFASREKFAIRYTSNQPGVVVIMNVDATQKTFYLGTFVISPGADMRFPAETNKGMVLDDNIGLETYQMLFMACLPPELTNQPDVIARKGQIPECGPTAQAEQTIILAQKGRRTKGTYNEALPLADGARKVVLSAAPYEKGDVTVTTFTINHVAPVAQQPLQQQQQLPSQGTPPAAVQPQSTSNGVV